MSDSEITKIPRPKQMRRLLHSQIKVNLFFAILATATAGMAWRVLVANPRRQRYADFYKEYDVEKEFERMRKKGLFQSVGPDDVLED